MFEAQVAGVLQRYLGKYVYGLDAESLKISVWRGDVELRNLRLKPEALEELNLPITVKSGLLGRLTLKVPWTKLGQEPVVAEFDRLYIVAGPRQDDSHGNAGAAADNPGDDAAEIEQEAKRQRISKAEDAWLKEMAAKNDTDATASNGASSEGGAVGRLRALLDTIIGNLELRITNVHIRYEDTTTNPGHSFCIGIMLQEISGHTVDENWQRAFVTADALLTLRKGVQLQSLCVYFDWDMPLLDPGKRWDLITRERWDKLLLPANHICGGGEIATAGKADLQLPATGPRAPSGRDGSQQQQQHQFLLCPVDGTLRYVRHGKRARAVESDAAQELHLQLEQINVCMHQLQYQSSQKLLQEFDRYAAGTPHRHLRPHCRPSAGAGGRLWWRYAIKAVQRQQQSYSSRAWQHLQMIAMYHKQYVSNYIRCLQQGKQGGDSIIAQLDVKLDEPVTLLFRRMAHAKFRAAQQKAGAANAGKQQPHQQGWFGWLMGGSQRPAHKPAHAAAAAGHRSAADSADMEVDILLGADEWNKLEQVVADQAAALGEEQDTPYTVRTILRVHVDMAAVELRDDDSRLLVQGAMHGVDSGVTSYPKTTELKFAVAKFGITSAHGPLIASGTISTSDEERTAAATPGSAMSLRLLRNPQDDSADVLVRLTLAPSYVTYNTMAIQEVAGFFKSDESLELSRLQAQAAARTDKLRHMAQLQLRALSERNAKEKPRMQLYMTLHAPKIAVPDSAGSATLIADLGCFIITTNTAALQSMSKEEAALYEAFIVKVDHVSAYLLDGAFAWPTDDTLARSASKAVAAAEQQPAGQQQQHEQQQRQASAGLREMLGQRSRVVSLLDRFGLGMDVQVATSVHPRYPVFRLAIAASPLQLHLSPFRYQQVMTVLQSMSPSEKAAAAAALVAGTTGTSGADKPLWLSEAEYSVKVSVLSWSGVTGQTAKWQSQRWLHVWRGRLYITTSKDATESELTKTYWMGYRAVQVSAALIGGNENVVAVIPKSLKVDDLAESSDAVAVRTSDAATATELRKRLMASASQMAAVAGLLELGEAQDQDTEIGTTKDVFEELLSHQLLLQLYGSISEVSLLLSGRSPVCWWPPDGLEALPSSSSITSMSGTTAPQQDITTGDWQSAQGFAKPVAVDSSNGAGRMLVQLEEEVDLLAIKFLGAQVGVTVSAEGFSAGVSMAALTMDDLVVGAKNPDKAHMAQSSSSDNQQSNSTPKQGDGAGGVAGSDKAGTIMQASTPAQQTSTPAGAEPEPANTKTINADENDEFYDAEDNDASTPRGGRTGSMTNAGPAAQDLSAASIAALSAALSGRSNQSSVLEGFGLGVDDSDFIAAPSFNTAASNFNATGGASKASADAGDAQTAEPPGAHAGGLVRLLFARHSPTGSNYQGLDTEVVLQLSTLVFYCNRPTVAALMVFGTDLSTVNALLALPDSEQDVASTEAKDTAAVAETATTESESVSDIQVVRSGGEQRILFKLTLKVAKVALHLNYEGDVAAPLAIGSIDNFLLELAVHPTTLELHTSLGNLVAEYGTLAEGHANRVMVSMRDRNAGSLIDVVFKMHSMKESFSESRVPSGYQYMSVAARLSTVQIIFMNSFLVEFLDYLAALLAMQAKPYQVLEAPATDAQPAAPHRKESSPVPATSEAQAAPGAKPLIVLLDVRLEAPVLVLPLNSNSVNHIEVDLGTLQVANRVVWEMRMEDHKQKLLVDDLQVTLQRISGCIVEQGVRGGNVIRELGGGVRVAVRRPLLADPLPMPPLTTAVAIPKLKASLLDSEYALILAVLAGNFAEVAALPRGIGWLHQQLLADKGPAAAAAAGGGGAVAAAAASSLARTMSPREDAVRAAGEEMDSADRELKRQVVSDFTCTSASLLGLLCDSTSVKTTVSIGHAQLMLWDAQPQGLPPAAVGSLEFSNMWVAVNNTHGGNMLLSVSLPSVCARDLRPSVPKEASLVLSTADIGASANLKGPLSGSGAIPLPTSCPSNRAAAGGGTECSKNWQDSSSRGSSGLLPSLLTLEHRVIRSISLEPVSALQVRLQRPTLVLDVGFIMKVLHFVAPSAGLQGPVPRPYDTREIHLGREPYIASDHIWLSPEYRIIADGPEVKDAVYDGDGHAIVLPDAVPPIEHVPLIVVGRGKTLRLRNVKVVNKPALAGVLSLGPGARLIAEEASGVSWHGQDEVYRLKNKQGRHIVSQKSSDSVAAGQQQAPTAAADSMHISVVAVGAAVYLIDAHTAAHNPAMQELPSAGQSSSLTAVPSGTVVPAALPDKPDPAECTACSAGGDAAGSSKSSRISTRGGSSNVHHQNDGEQEEMLKMLGLYLDMLLDINMQGPHADMTAQLRGLSMKAQTQLLESAVSGLEKQQGSTAPKQLPSAFAHLPTTQQQEAATSILEPCDVHVVMKTTADVQDLNVNVSAVQLRMSPDVMQLLLHLQQVVWEPLAVPPASVPLTRVDRFGGMWSSHTLAEGIGPPYAIAGAGGVDVVGSDKGVTVWRPQPPTGYAILGDVLSSGHSQPDHQVVAIALNSGFVTYPNSYTLVWEAPGVGFWRPVPPAGYVAMGCVVSVNTNSTARPAPPSHKACVVVAKQAVVDALLSECMMLSTTGNLWAIQNGCGTFEVAPPDAHQPQVPLYDLRSPLGVAPAALTPLSQSASATSSSSHNQPGNDSTSVDAKATLFAHVLPPPSLVAARAFAAHRATLRAKIARSGQVTSTVEFARIWWDKHAKHPSLTKVSFWRALPPAGYVVLGDCMVTSMYCPPSHVLVLRDTDPAELVGGKPPLLARPLRCLQVWADTHKISRGDSNYLTLWKPIPPAGYIALGMLANTGGKEPPSLSQVRCVRADMATRVDLQPNSPALIIYPYKNRTALAGWMLDERTSTFTVVSHDGSPQVLEGYRLKELQEDKNTQQAERTATGPPALQLSLSVGKTNLLLRNLLRIPILELESAKINLGLSQEPSGVRRCFAYVTTSLWSYHQSMQVWEPVMEPWQLLLHMDVNPNQHSSAGIAPGTNIRLSSPHGTVHVTVAQAALNYVLDALMDWQGVAAPDGSTGKGAKSLRQGLTASDGLTVNTTVQSTLDTAIYLQLDYGEGRREIVVLPPHAVTPVAQPMPVPPISHAPPTAGPPPVVRLLVDVLEGQLQRELSSAGSMSELLVKVRVTGKLAQQLSAATEGMITRAVLVGGSTKAQAEESSSTQQQGQSAVHVVRWNERFVLALPPNLAEQLLTPAPGDNPYEGVAVELQISVIDGSGEHGLGRVVSSTTLQVTYDWLLSQIQALLDARQAAAAAATEAALHDDQHSKAFRAVDAKCTSLGKQYTLELPLNSTGAAAAEDQCRDGDTAAVSKPEAMQLTVAVSIDDSHVSSSWYPHQRMRRELAYLFSLRSSGREGTVKLAGSTTGSGPATCQQGQLPGTAAAGNRHALRLEGSDVWSPFSYTSLRRMTGTTTGPHTGIVPIRAGQGLVLELSYTGGQYQARIRSLCQFINSTDMVLEVALLEEDDSSWTVLPHTASSPGSQRAAVVGDVVEEEVFEHERYMPLRGWSPDHLKGLDPHRYSRQRNGSRGSDSFPKVLLPQGWEWEGPWGIEAHGNVDADGWAYAFDPTQFRWPPTVGAAIKKAHDFVRRRRFVRKRRRIALPTSVLDVTAAGQSNGSSPGPTAPPAGGQLQRRILGRVEPGDSLPLPQDWRTDNKQLQLRPILAVRQHFNGANIDVDVPSNAWSYGVSGGQHSVLIASLEDGASRLLCCKTLGVEADESGNTATSPRKAAAVAPSCWFSVSCEATDLVLQSGVDVLTDWRITAQPPLSLRNDLPVAAHYVLWEQAAQGGSLVLRQQGRLEGWASTNVYSVDMRQQVCLTFHPEGAEWAEPEPVLISEGCLGSTAGVDSAGIQLPDSFSVSYSNSQANNARLRIALTRHIDTELLDSQRMRAAAARAAAVGSSSSAVAALSDGSADAWRLSAGAALAQGRPLVLSLSVPVWVENGTQLPVSIGIVPFVSAPDADTGGGEGAGSDALSGFAPGQLKVLDTEAYTQITRPASHITIMGNSIELLSFPGEGPDGSGVSSRNQYLGSLELANQAGADGIRQWAAVISIMGSRWSAPLVLAAASPSGGSAAAGAGPTSSAVGKAISGLPRYEPMLILAKCRDGCVYETTVRIESAGTGLPLSTVVRLDPHIVVSNRTGYMLQLLQPEPIYKVLGPSIADAAGSNRGSSSSSQAAWFPAGAASLTSSLPTRASVPRQSGTVSAAATSQVKDSTMVLRAGSLAVPLSWPVGCVRRLLVLTLPYAPTRVSGVGSAAPAIELVDPVMWSEPFRIGYPATGMVQVLVPLYRLGTPGDPKPVNEASIAAAQAAFHTLLHHDRPQAAGGKAVAGSTAGSTAAGQQGSQQQADGISPLLIHMAKRTEAGLSEYLAVTVNVSIEMPVPGCLHVVLQSLGGEPQHCLMNGTAVPISYRQAVSKAAWQLLPPYSGAALVLVQPSGCVTGALSGPGLRALPSCSDMELRDGDPQTSGSTICSLDGDSSGLTVAQGSGKRAGSGGTDQPAVFSIAGGKTQALAQVLPVLESVMDIAGPHEVPGAGSVSVGRTVTDRLLRVLPKPTSVSCNQLRLAASLAGQDQSRLSPASAWHVNLEVPALDVSVVDGRPQELLLLSLDGLTVEYHSGNSAGTAYTQVLLRVNFAQLDDMLHTSPFPVVLVPADKTVLEDPAADPLMFFTHVTQPSRFRGALYTPTICGRVAALRLRLSETLVWRLYDLSQSLAASSHKTDAGAGEGGSSDPAGKPNAQSRRHAVGVSSSGVTAAAAGATAGGAVQQVASADLPLQVDLLSLDDLPLRVSFRTDKSTRPRWANSMWVFNTLGEMLNLDELQLTIPGLELEGTRAARSALIHHALKQLQAQALAIVFNVFRSYGVLGTATKLLVVGSNITSAITGTSSSALGVGSGSGERVGNVGQGFVEGTRTFGEGLIKGVTGIVADPLAGAKQGGVLGFMSGVGRGLVGVPGQIIGGALSAASKVTEGLDASVNKMKEQITGAEQTALQRRRLPRCIRGDHILTPYAVGLAIGLGLLHNCGAGPIEGLVKGATTPLQGSSSSGGSSKGILTDSYEAHMTLPGTNVAVITNMRLLMVQAEGFAQLEAEAAAGRLTQVNTVPLGRLLWQLTWDQMLSAELAYHRQQPGAPPDGVIVHRKYRSEETDVLVHDIRCYPNNQAVWLYEALSAARQKYYAEPRREARGWKVTPVIAAEQQNDQEMPDVMLSVDFKRVWQSSRSGARPLSVWRPVGPPGYVSLGHVAMPGREPPARPVAVYKDVTQQACGADKPALAMPERYQLIFRDSGFGVSMWRPIPPKGYLEVGHVVIPAIEEPPVEVVRCMRVDLLKPATLYDYPVWSDVSSDNTYWQCSIWQVDNPCCSFVAVKGTSKPHQRQAVAPTY